MSSRDRPQDLFPDVPYTLDLQRAEPAGGTFVLTIVGDIDARASDSSLAPGFRIVAEQPMYSAAWL